MYIPVVQKATHLTIYAKQRYIKWKITKFSSSAPVRRLLCSKCPQKFVHTSLVQKLQIIGHIFVRTVKAHVHSVMHGQLWKPQHTYVKRAIR